MKKREKKAEDVGNWMDTYGDMVTLLLCFFVLLYSMSSVDQQKWKLIVESFNPSAVSAEDQVVVGANVMEGEGELKGNTPPQEDAQTTEFEDIYLSLVQMVESRGLTEAVEITYGEGFTFISFRDKVFFDGDSSVLLGSGKSVLDEFAGVIGRASASIQEIQVLGHTSQVPTRPYNIRNDRMLSAQRSAEVIIYLQSLNVIEPEKMVALSFGQFRPIEPVDTDEGRAKNRRVEMLITKDEAVEKSLNEYYNQVYDKVQN